jgi:HAD superfamily hydrolase (TIGR01549 family)
MIQMLFIFDFDSTLVELEGVPWTEVKREVLDYGRKEGFEIDPETHLVNISNKISDTKERKAEVDRIFRKYEKRAVEAGNFTIYESTVPTLGTLKAMGHKVAVASNNTEPTIREVLEAGEIPADAIRGRTSVMRPKPYADMLESLMGEFNSPKPETFMIGDNFWDEGAGAAAGIKTFIIKPGTLDISLFEGIL